MFMYPPGVQMIIYKQHEKELLEDVARYQSTKTTSRQSVSFTAGIVQFLNSKLFHARQNKEVCAEC
jgi:hypothetical protein